MSPKSLRVCASIARGISYALVFFVGLVIGFGGKQHQDWPIIALIPAIIFGIAAGILTEAAIRKENLAWRRE